MVYTRTLSYNGDRLVSESISQAGGKSSEIEYKYDKQGRADDRRVRSGPLARRTRAQVHFLAEAENAIPAKCLCLFLGAGAALVRPGRRADDQGQSHHARQRGQGPGGHHGASAGPGARIDLRLLRRSECDPRRLPAPALGGRLSHRRGHPCGGVAGAAAGCGSGDAGPETVAKAKLLAPQTGAEMELALQALAATWNDRGLAEAVEPAATRESDQAQLLRLVLPAGDPQRTSAQPAERGALSRKSRG